MMPSSSSWLQIYARLFRANRYKRVTFYGFSNPEGSVPPNLSHFKMKPKSTLKLPPRRSEHRNFPTPTDIRKGKPPVSPRGQNKAITTECARMRKNRRLNENTVSPNDGAICRPGPAAAVKKNKSRRHWQRLIFARGKKAGPARLAGWGSRCRKGDAAVW